jgi:hypothetical protein
VTGAEGPGRPGSDPQLSPPGCPGPALGLLPVAHGAADAHGALPRCAGHDRRRGYAGAASGRPARDAALDRRPRPLRRHRRLRPRCAAAGGRRRNSGPGALPEGGGLPRAHLPSVPVARRRPRPWKASSRRTSPPTGSARPTGPRRVRATPWPTATRPSSSAIGACCETPVSDSDTSAYLQRTEHPCDPPGSTRAREPTKSSPRAAPRSLARRR